MAVMRALLLSASRSSWLRTRAERYRFVRRAVARFMPGEALEDALAAARELARVGIGTILTHLGENLRSRAEAEAVGAHYREVLDRVAAEQLDAVISVKPTQLGLDLDADFCLNQMRTLAREAAARGSRVWIDMESSPYVDPTLQIYRRLRGEGLPVGVCLQAYLRRTPADIESLLPLGPAIRLVKGAYREPATLAFPRKKDVDRQFVVLAERLLDEAIARPETMVAVATHDRRIIHRVECLVTERRVPRGRYEFELLYGIQRAEQVRLAASGQPTRVLISYGHFWFPWFMRRLAERPANVLFLVRHLFAA
jgi:proline dehydrogenase